ncbi:hypothetical protein AB4305_01095 [Nocardia sp. 2YAB30]|uniref:hypothetical protein n=1 Tax=unclassified Nocardia TaxID=2637762 RepID=UPI003F977A27
MDLEPLIARNYALYGCLFGVRSELEFRPVAADRGQPDNASPRLRTTLRSEGLDAHSVTWITWDEIKTIDLDEQAEHLTSRPLVYQRLPDGSEIYLYRGDFLPEFPRLEHDGSVYRYWTPDGKPWVEGAEWNSPNGDIYRYARPRRRHVLNQPWWQTICRLCEVVEPSCGADNIRLVVWFDN